MLSGDDTTVSGILLVQEHPEPLARLREALVPLGARLFEVASYEAALQVLARQDVACLVVDGRTGAGAARDLGQRIGSSAHPVGLVVLTALPREEAELMRGVGQGAVDYLSTPHTPEELRERVHAVWRWTLRERQRLLEERRERERERAAHQETQRSHARLRAFFMDAPAIINLMHGPEHTFEFVNTRFLELLGERHFLGKTVREAQPELVGQGIYELLDRVYQTGTPFRGETVPVRVAPGPGLPTEERFYTFTYQPMRGAGGEVEGVSSFAFDVTELVLAQRELEGLADELRHSEQQLQLIFEGVREYAIFLITPQGRIASWNPGVERMNGYSAGEFIGLPFATLFTPEQRRLGLPDQELETASREGVHKSEGERVRKNGTHYLAEVVLQALRDPQGQLRGFVKVTRDITERKQAEVERERLLQERGEALRLRDSFLSIASHELRTPLTTLRLKLERLVRSVSAMPERGTLSLTRKDLDVMRRQVRRLTALVNDLMEASRPELGSPKLRLEPVDLGQLVRDVAEHLLPEAQRSGCGLEVRAAQGLVGVWDRSRLEQVVERLVSNALKYGAGKPVLVSAEHTVGRARLVVRDEGIGFTPEARERIFGKFERDVSERNYGGLGLGLYFTRRIVEALGGTVSAEGLPGKGATFTVELPL